MPHGGSRMLEDIVRTRSRVLREQLVRALAGTGLVLALAVLGAVLVSTAADGDARATTDSSVALAPGGGMGDSVGSDPAPDQTATQGSEDPSWVGILFGVVLLSGGIAVLGWGARRPRSESAAPAERRVLQSVAD